MLQVTFSNSNSTDTLTYESWDSSSNSGFMTVDLCNSICLDTGLRSGSWGDYTWSVQALNGSVPGPFGTIDLWNWQPRHY